MDIKQIAIRGGFVAISLVLWFWTQKIISQKAPKTTGVGDQLHVLTEKLNAWLHANPGAANLTLIISSLGIASAEFSCSAAPSSATRSARFSPS